MLRQEAGRGSGDSIEPANANGSGYASFGFKVSDSTALSASAYTLTVNVTAVRDDLKLTGSAGNDTLDFNALSEMGLTLATWDVITDFVRGQDQVDLSTLDADTGVAGDQLFSAPVVGGTFSGAFAHPGDLYFDSVAQVLYGNTDADAAAEFAIQLTGVSTPRIRTASAMLGGGSEAMGGLLGKCPCR